MLDAPSPASSLAPSKKKTVGVILGGALAGMLASFLAVVAMTPANSKLVAEFVEIPMLDRGASEFSQIRLRCAAAQFMF